MKLVLEAEGVKRELAGPFNIAMSRADLDTLRTQLDRVAAEWDAGGCRYGWAAIYPKAQGPGPNSTPRRWSE